MKRILIITFYFPPYTGVAGYRPLSWAVNFKKHGLSPIVVTRHWEKGGQNSWLDSVPPYGTEVEKTEEPFFEIYKTPHRHRRGYQWNDKSIFRSFKYWMAKFKGHIMIDADSYTSFKPICEKIITENKIDYILVSSGPLNLIRLGHELSSKYKIPFIADFRDTHNNNLLQHNPRLSFHEKVDKKIFEYWLRKWLRNVVLVTGVSQPLLNLMQKLHHAKSKLIFNGYEESLFDELSALPTTSDRFVITILGNLYQRQDIDFMTAGFKEFITQNPDVLIQFVGTTGSGNKISDKIKAAIPAANLLLTNPKLRPEAISMAARSHVLYYIGWKGYRGIYSGKIFEYLGLQRNILLAPSDNDVNAALIDETKSGKVADTIEEMVAVLSGWYQEWKHTGRLQYEGNTAAIKKYTREKQSEILAETILAN